MVANLLVKYMKAHPRVYERMIAAYVVGYPIQGSYLEHHPYLKFAKGPSDTGVIVSWNTEAPTVAAGIRSCSPAPSPSTPSPGRGRRRRRAPPRTAAPSSWTRPPACPSSTPTGTIKCFLKVADARVDKARGVVICSSINAADPPYFRPGGFPMGVLHTFDYPLYFFSVRANAADRVQHFFAER